MLTQLAKDYANAQHSLEWSEFSGGAAFEVILTALLAIATGGVGAIASLGAQTRKISQLKKLGALLTELAEGLKNLPKEKPFSLRKLKEAEDKKAGKAQPPSEKPAPKSESSSASEKDNVGGTAEGDDGTMRGDENIQNTHKSNRGSNEGVWTTNSEGRPVSVEATLREDFGSTKRSSSEKTLQSNVGKDGVKGDEGGHFIGHRFLGDQGLKNLFPQNFNLNRGAYRSMEGYFADLTKQGFEVKVSGSLYPPGATRPEKIKIQYQVFDPNLGKMIESSSFKFTNQSGQKFVKP